MFVGLNINNVFTIQYYIFNNIKLTLEKFNVFLITSIISKKKKLFKFIIHLFFFKKKICLH